MDSNAPFDYLISTRRIRTKTNEFDAEPGVISYLKVPAAAPVPTPDHRLSNQQARQQWLDEVRHLADGDCNPNSVSPAGDVLVFIHGYNNDLDIVMRRQRQLSQDLRAEGWRGVVIGFDWPSDDSTLNYLEDRLDASKTAIELVRGIKVLQQGQQQGCITNVHLLGHSTGAYVIMEALAQAEKDGELFRSSWRIGQVALIGADVAAESLRVDSQWAQPMFQRIMRLTNYSNPFDRVLAVSNAKRLGTAARVGRVGLPKDAHPKAVNVDCGDYFQTIDPSTAVRLGTFNHSWHIGNRVFARDLAMTLEGAISRHAIPTRQQTPQGLQLRDAPRPQFQQLWELT